MSQATAIGWTDVTWNPTHGCSIKSTECRSCYAMTLSLRYGQTLKPWTPANAGENVLLKPHKLREPLSNAKHWRGLGAAAALAGKTDGMLVFVNSMSDLFHEQVPDEFVARVFAVMAVARRHTFQVLTKRPERMPDLLTRPAFWGAVAREAAQLDTDTGYALALAATIPGGPPPVLPNVWLGTSIGLRHFAGRADYLRATPAAVRFISAEPLLGPLVVGRCADASALDLAGIDWLISGGESGSGHRPMDLDWCRDIRDACDREGVAYFYKQPGGARPGGDRLLDGRTWDEFPASKLPVAA